MKKIVIFGATGNVGSYVLKYAREYIKDTKLAELTGIPAAQLGRYANDKSKPRPAQRRKIIEALHKFAAPFYSIVL